jgi:hypothetical protein
LLLCSAGGSFAQACFAEAPDSFQGKAEKTEGRIAADGKFDRSARKPEYGKEGTIPMNEEIGTMAGEIWHALEANGEVTLAKLKKELKATSPIFDWAIGWLAREDKIMMTMEKRSTRICLKGWHTQSMHAA